MPLEGNLALRLVAAEAMGDLGLRHRSTRSRERRIAGELARIELLRRLRPARRSAARGEKDPLLRRLILGVLAA